MFRIGELNADYVNFSNNERDEEFSYVPPKYLAVPPFYVHGSLLSVARYPRTVAKVGIIIVICKKNWKKLRKRYVKVYVNVT